VLSRSAPCLAQSRAKSERCSRKGPIRGVPGYRGRPRRRDARASGWGTRRSNAFAAVETAASPVRSRISTPETPVPTPAPPNSSLAKPRCADEEASQRLQCPPRPRRRRFNACNRLSRRSRSRDRRRPLASVPWR
jgi:hypothetical protein